MSNSMFLVHRNVKGVFVHHLISLSLHIILHVHVHRLQTLYTAVNSVTVNMNYYCVSM